MSEVIKHKFETPTPSKEYITQEPEGKLDETKNSVIESLDRQQEQLESARSTIETQAKSNESVNLDQKTNETVPAHHYITKHIKADGYKKTIKHVQKDLTPSEARFSRIIHQPKIETISEFGAKTVARPSSIVTGSLMALLLGIVLIIVAKHIGFYVTPLVFTVLFIIGYLLGLLLELVTKIVLNVFKHKPHYQ